MKVLQEKVFLRFFIMSEIEILLDHTVTFGKMDDVDNRFRYFIVNIERFKRNIWN